MPKGRSAKNTKVINRRKLKSVENIAIWVHSGGMCALCRKNLIFDDENVLVNFGEQAHVVAHSPGGPRGDEMANYGLTRDTVDSVQNLMLLCMECHTKIDTNVEKYPAEWLYQKKLEHETWVKSRIDPNNRVVAVIHKTMHDPIDHVELADRIDALLIECVALQEKFTNFTEEGWLAAKRDNEEFYKKVMQTKQKYHGTSVSVFPLSQIPLLVHLGYLMSDTMPATIYQYDRDTGRWISNAPLSEGPLEPLGVYVDEHMAISANTLVVTVSVSGLVDNENVDAVIHEPYHVLKIGVENPRINRVLYQEHVQEIRKAFKYNAERLQEKNKYKAIHLFYAGPAGLAIELGRCINENTWPEVHLYHYRNRENPKYQHAFHV